MTQPTPVPATDDDNKRMREKVDKLLARDAHASDGSITHGEHAMPYSTVAAFVPVTAGGVDHKRGEPEAAIFTIAYLLKDADPRKRPVCFAFNGGPGAASVFLNLGALGPKRVVINEDGTMPSPPYTVVDNPQSWFDHFDLVFVDPPHTGYSRTASEDARKRMLSVAGDVAALAECVRTWLGRHRRWGSPIFVAGESYGTTRGAALTDALQEMGVAVSGLILVSCAMDAVSRNGWPSSPGCPWRWWKRRTCASATRPSSSNSCAIAGRSSAGSRLASRGRWPRAAPANGSSIRASKLSPRRSRWPPTRT